MNEPRVYKNSPFLFILMLLIFGVLFIGLVSAMGRETWYIMIPFALAFGIIFLVAMLSLTSKTIISDEEISTQNLLGTKTLRWSEINQVSGWGHAIKLRDMDRNLTVAPSPQLPGYPEVIEWIGIKRPDLFSPMEYAEMSKSWAATAAFPIAGLAMLGLGAFLYTQTQSNGDTFFPVIFLVFVGLGFLIATFTSIQAVSIEGNSIVIGYLFNQKTLLADEIASVNLSYTQTRNGKNYFVALYLTNKKTVRLSGLRPNLPVVYLVLKNWHRKNTGTNNSSSRL